MKKFFVLALMGLFAMFAVIPAMAQEASVEEKNEQAQKPAAEKASELTRTIGVFITEDPDVVLSGKVRTEVTKTVERQAVASGKYELKRFPEKTQLLPAKEKCEMPCRAAIAKEQGVDFFVSLAVSQMGEDVFLNGELTSQEGKVIRTASVKVIGADNGAYNAAKTVSEKLFLMRSMSAVVQSLSQNQVKTADADLDEEDYETFVPPLSVYSGTT